ncbi:MAG: RagB/SusD family nutrient uptake outer membrane protein [Gemmatimonadaceae bacterium]
MPFHTRKAVAVAASALALLGAAGCNVDVTNPNQANQHAIFTTREGIVRLAVGVQSRWGEQQDDFIFPGGLITDELGAKKGALQSYRDAATGVLDPTYDAVRLSWLSHYRTVATADDILANAPNVAELSDSTRSGVMVLAMVAKAEALGQLLQQYKQIVIHPTPGANVYVDRAAALAEVRSLLDKAAQQYATLRPGAEFTTQIKDSRLDLKSTIPALQARYARLANDWQAALAAANQVDLASFSRFSYSASVVNPVASGFAAYALPLDTLKLAAETGDARVAYHERLDSAVAGDLNRTLHPFAQFANAAASVPVYYPGEVQLIRAEAEAQLGQLSAAAAAVDSVRTKCAAGAATPQACLQPLLPTELDTKEKILAEVYRQRKLELFGTGLRWEDARRLGSVGPALIARRCWLMYPIDQRNADSSVPADPEPASPPSSAVASCF